MANYPTFHRMGMTGGCIPFGNPFCFFLSDKWKLNAHEQPTYVGQAHPGLQRLWRIPHSWLQESRLSAEVKVCPEHHKLLLNLYLSQDDSEIMTESYLEDRTFL